MKGIRGWIVPSFSERYRGKATFKRLLWVKCDFIHSFKTNFTSIFITCLSSDILEQCHGRVIRSYLLSPRKWLFVRAILIPHYRGDRKEFKVGAINQGKNGSKRTNRILAERLFARLPFRRHVADVVKPNELWERLCFDTVIHTHTHSFHQHPINLTDYLAHVSKQSYIHCYLFNF